MAGVVGGESDRLVDNLPNSQLTHFILQLEIFAFKPFDVGSLLLIADVTTIQLLLQTIELLL